MLDARHISLQLGIRPGEGQGIRPRAPGAPGAVSAGPSFKEMLERAADDSPSSAEGLRFSKHAQKRLASRNIELTSGDLEKIEQAVDTARRKGGRDSLVLMGDLALVVSIKNNTVITAVDENSSKENVFTNIDSAVIARF
jgi:flagellar operon protein